MPGSRSFSFPPMGKTGRSISYIYSIWMGGWYSQAHIRNKETTVLTTISEGNYLFEVFTDDERIENGQLTVR